MNRVLLPVALVLFTSMLSSCQDASFNEVKTTLPPNNFWFTAANQIELRGPIHNDFGGPGNTMPPNAKVILGWEMPNSLTRMLYIYGTGTVTKSQYDMNKYEYDITITDTIPIFVLRGMDTVNALAVAHLFLVSDNTLVNGDTLSNSLDWDLSYHMLGSFNDVCIAFSKGLPVLDAQTPAISAPTFSLLHAKRIDNMNPAGPLVKDFEPENDPIVEVQFDGNGKSCKDLTPFWLQ